MTCRNSKQRDLREILRSNSESTGGMRANVVMKFYALLMRHVFPSSGGENQELLTDVQDLEQNQSDFKYEATMVRISALGWSSDLRNLPKMNFNQPQTIDRSIHRKYPLLTIMTLQRTGLKVL